jgi:hypothetical protein
MCHLVTEFASDRWGWARAAVAYLSPDGCVICAGHYVCVLPGGAILDPTADQFGERHDVRILYPEDPEHTRYRMEWDGDYNPSTDAECAAAASFLGTPWTGEDDLDAQNRNRTERGAGWWLSDTAAYAAYWAETLALAEAAGDSFSREYARHARAILDALAAHSGSGNPLVRRG